jgi:Alcohol dehydrogenase GroES-like domain
MHIAGEGFERLPDRGLLSHQQGEDPEIGQTAPLRQPEAEVEPPGSRRRLLQQARNRRHWNPELRVREARGRKALGCDHAVRVETDRSSDAAVESRATAEVPRLETVAAGEPGPGQARVRHRYVAVNFIDVYFRTGRYPLSLPNGLGSDAVGMVEAVGSGVTEVKVGDRVGYLLGPQGAYADVRVMPADVLIPLPDGISDRTASTLMMKGMTVQYLFRQVYPLRGGETILFHAAAGGVGVIACQWARALGVTMIGAVSTDEKAEIARANGGRESFSPTRSSASGLLSIGVFGRE